MFTNSQKLYVRNTAALGRWRAAKNAISAYTAAPIGFSIWDMIQSPNLKEVFIYLLFVVAIVSVHVVCSGKVAHYHAMVSLLRARLDHPPNKINESNETSANLKEG